MTTVAARLQQPDIIPDLEPALHIEPQGRFVEKQDVGVG